MIIINKKRILLIIAILLVAVFSFSVQTFEKENTISTVALPVSNKVIILDARTWKTR